MRHKSLYLGCGLLLAALLLSGFTDLQGHQAGGKTIKMKLLLPTGEDRFQVGTKVLVDGKEVEGKGEERTLTVTTPQDKDYVTVTAIWETMSTVQMPPNLRPPPPAVVSRRRDERPRVIFSAGRMPVTAVARSASPIP